MKYGCACLALLVAAVSAPAQPRIISGMPQKPAAPEPEPAPKVFLLRPAAEPVPALKYQLLPEIKDQTPGNAAVLYYRAFSPEWWVHRLIYNPKTEKWLKMPLGELPRAEIRSEIPISLLRELDLAARREQCDWQITDQVRSQGPAFLLPDVGGFRTLGNLLALRARIQIADGRYDEALYTLQTGFALGRHVNEMHLIICSLVGIAIETPMIDQLEELMQAANSPNLYWALTQLPCPLINFRGGFQAEKLVIFSIPDLERLEDRPLTLAQVQRIQENFEKAYDIRTSKQAGFEKQLFIAAQTMRAYPEAKRALIARGRKPEEVEAMPALQVVLIQTLYEYRRLQDDKEKWLNLPYWEARPGLEQVERRFQAEIEQGLPQPFPLLVPALRSAIFRGVCLDRRIALLRCIEAIRLHAKAHDGKLPASLADITEVPVPIDPVTGKSFIYEAADDKASLVAPAPPGEKANQINFLHYELKLAR